MRVERLYLVKDKHKWLSLSRCELLASGEVQLLSIVARFILRNALEFRPSSYLERVLA